MNNFDGGISFSPMSEDDMDFLYSLCKSTMEDYVIKAWGAWSEEFVHRELGQALSSEEFSAIICDGERIGAVSIVRHDTHYQLEQLYIDRL